MKYNLTPTELGQNLLVVIDNSYRYLDSLQDALENIPDRSNRYFTMLHCCPTIYWEHGGPCPDLEQTIRAIQESEDEAIRMTWEYFEKVRIILRDVGVPASHIQCKLGLFDNVLDAVTNELEHNNYSGVILSTQHTDLINRLEHKGLLNRFRRFPHVVVWTLNSSIETPRIEVRNL